MRIIYLTTAMMPKDFNNLVKISKVKPNPSSQNFHYKIIHELKKNNDVTVISLRPANSTTCDQHYFEHEINDIFIYPTFFNKKLFKNFTFIRNSKKIISSLKYNEQPIVLVDLLNPHLAKLAHYIRKNHGGRIVGIITDNPNNLSNVNHRYIKKVESSFSYCNAYITLTENLNKYINRRNRPFLIIPGILSEDIIVKEMPVNYKYIFFGGALYERYGVRNLIEAFKKVNTEARLIIAGHGPMKEEIALLAENDPRFIYAGLLSFREMLQYQQHALININPRIFTSDLDYYSIPSKVIDYADSNMPTISSLSHDLKKIYGDSIHWIYNSSIDQLAQEITNVLKNIDEKKQKAIKAKMIGRQHFDPKIIGNKINSFFKELF
jgi:glycosyltransferase involved in cell wall biosynthesis